MLTAKFEEGKGTVVDFKSVPMIQTLRQRLPALLGPKASDLLAELNYYYDVRKCYIGMHQGAKWSRFE
jgi:hypothetical protein